MIKCVSLITNGLVNKGSIYHLEYIDGYWCIFDENMIHVCSPNITTPHIPRAFIEIQKHRDIEIDKILK